MKIAIKILLEVVCFILAIGLGQDLMKWKEKRDDFVGTQAFMIATSFHVLLSIAAHFV